MEGIMARIIEAEKDSRRIIKLSTDDILSVVKEYQRIVGKQNSYLDIRSILEDNVIFIPEEV
jgi:hypothetical protein